MLVGAAGVGVGVRANAAAANAAPRSEQEALEVSDESNKTPVAQAQSLLERA